MSLGEWAWKPTNWEPMQEAPFFFNIMKFNIIFFSFYLIVSCNSSKEDRTITEKEILMRFSAVDPTVRLLPDKTDVVGCQNYVGCKKFTRTLFNNIEIFLIEMNSERIAKEYAQKKDVLYIGNWLIDNIQREKEVRIQVKKAIDLDLKNIKPQEEKKSDH